MAHVIKPIEPAVLIETVIATVLHDPSAAAEDPEPARAPAAKGD